MDHLHSNWKDKVANMGEAPEVTPEVIARVSDLYRRQWASIAPPMSPLAQALDAVTAARQAAGMAAYRDSSQWAGAYMLPQGMGDAQQGLAGDVPTLTDALELPATVTRESIDTFLGRSLASKVRRRQRWAGTYAVAKQLRKQGFGLLVARLLLLGRP